MRYLCDVYVKVFLMQAHPIFTGVRIKCQMFPRLKPGNFWKWSKVQGGITAIWETCEPRMTHIVISSKSEIHPEFQLWDASHQFEKRVNRQHGSILSHSFFSARLPQLPNLKSLFFAHFHWNFQSGSFQQKKVSLHFERNLMMMNTSHLQLLFHPRKDWQLQVSCYRVGFTGCVFRSGLYASVHWHPSQDWRR